MMIESDTDTPISPEENIPEKHSEEMQEIISSPPSWLYNWGMSIFICLLFGLLGMTQVIKYPDSVRFPLTVNTVNGPVVLKAAGIEKLTKFMVRSHDSVKKGQPLVLFGDTAGAHDALLLLESLDSKKGFDIWNRSNYHLPPDLIESYRQFKADDGFLERQQTQVKHLLPYEKNLNFEKLSQLADQWAAKHLLRAPVSGMVLFSGLVIEGEFTRKEDVLFEIADEHAQYFGTMFIPEDIISKIKVGQNVLIRMKGSEGRNAGSISGNIISVADLPSANGAYLCRVNLQLSGQKWPVHPFQLKNHMRMDADIITEDKTLFGRITGSLIKTRF